MKPQKVACTTKPAASVHPRPQAQASRLALINVRNDDGHHVGFEQTWIPLGDAVASVLRRLSEGGAR